MLDAVLLLEPLEAVSREFFLLIIYLLSVTLVSDKSFTVKVLGTEEYWEMLVGVESIWGGRRGWKSLESEEG